MEDIVSKIEKQYEKLAFVICEVGSNLTLVGRWKEAKELYEFGLSLDIEKKFKAKMQVHFGEILIRQGKLNKANEILNEAKSIAEEIKDDKLLADVLYEIGEYHYINYFMKEIGNYQKSLDVHNEALKIRKKIKDQKGMTHSLSRVGVIYERMGDFETALKYHNKSLSLANKIDYPRGAERALIHIGSFEQRQGNLQKTLELYKLAMERNTESNDKAGQAFRLMNLGGILYRINEDKEEYLDYLNKGLKIAEKIDHKIAISFINYRLGMLFSELGEKKKALEIFISLIDLAKEIDFIFPQKIAKDQIEKLEHGDNWKGKDSFKI